MLLTNSFVFFSVIIVSKFFFYSCLSWIPQRLQFSCEVCGLKVAKLMMVCMCAFVFVRPGQPRKQRKKSKKLWIKERFSLQRLALTPTVSLLVTLFILQWSQSFLTSNCYYSDCYFRTISHTSQPGISFAKSESQEQTFHLERRVLITTLEEKTGWVDGRYASVHEAETTTWMLGDMFMHLQY